MNRAILEGNLGCDVETKLLPDGRSVANFRMATNESYKNKEGKLVSKATWHRVVCFGKLAETCTQYLAKGRQVLVEGKISNRSYTAGDGTTRYVSEVVASQVTFLGAKPKSDATDVPPLSDEDAPVDIADVTF